MNLDMELVSLKSLSPYLFKESKNVLIGCRMRHGHCFGNSVDNYVEKIEKKYVKN
jgi:hypothetical protein